MQISTVGITTMKIIKKMHYID